MRNNDNRYDVFISYRRDGGYDTAQLLYDRLAQMRYRVSFDLETLRGGKFNTQLYQRIEQCTDVLVVMSKDSLVLRENPEDDWFRLEISHALKHKKNIVPVFLRDFKAPQKGELPDDVMELMEYNGVVASQEHFDSVLKQICGRLKARPRRPYMCIAVLAATLLLLIAAVGVAWYNRATLFPFPFWRADKQRFSEIKELATKQITCYCIVADAEAKLLDAAETAAHTDLVAEFHNEVERFNRSFSQVDVEALKPSDRLLELTSKTPIEVGDLMAFWEDLANGVRCAKDDAAFLEHTIATRRVMTRSDLLNLFRARRRIQAAYASLYAYDVMGLFSLIADDAIADIKQKLAPMWASLPDLSRPWLRNEADIRAARDKSITDFQNAMNEMSAVVGNQNIGLRQQEKTLEELKKALGDTADLPSKVPGSPEGFRQQLEQMGATSEQVETQMAKIENILSLKRKITETEDEIAAIKSRSREKFAPTIKDDTGVLWGKALRFLALDMRDDALLCVDVLRCKQSAEFPMEACTAAEVFIRSRGRIPFASGVMVTGIEPSATGHAIYRIGDIITCIDGRIVATFKDYHVKAGSVYTVYRCEDGILKRIDLTMTENQPRVALVNLMETED